jgi:Mg-chelatase subunit ChlD
MRQFHRPGVDRGAVVTFGNDARIACDFTPDEDRLHTSLMGLDRSVADGRSRTGGEGTQLYDGLVDTAAWLAGRGRPGTPWLLIALTDGNDKGSVRFRGDPGGCGRAVAAALSRGALPLTVLLGVGPDGEVDRAALSAVGAAAGAAVLALDTFAHLGDALLRLATQVSAGVRIDRTIGPGFWGERVTPELSVRQVPFDYVLLIDRSGSMGDPA